MSGAVELGLDFFDTANVYNAGESESILGVSSVEHLEDAVEAVDVNLSASDLAYLEEPYEPVGITGH